MLFKNIVQQYFNMWIKLANFKKRANLFIVDFKKPWWKILSAQKLYIFYIITTNTIETIFFTLVPQLIGIILNSQNYFYFILFIICGLFIVSIHYISDYYTALLQMQSICSLQYYAHRYFLIVDPVYRTTRSSGTVIGKIDRGIDSYEDIVDIITTDFLPTIVGIITVIITLLHYNSMLALIALVLIIITGIINTSLQMLTNRAFEPEIINAADQLNNISVENLTQINFIRSTFASNEINNILKNKNKHMLNIGGSAWLAFSAIYFITHAIYIISLLILGCYLICLTHNGIINALTATALILTYISGSKEVLKIGRKIRKFLKSLTRVSDLFNFINNFGKQTFPVLDTIETEQKAQKLIDKYKSVDKSNKIISIDATNIDFDYNNDISIFNNHSFHLDMPCEQENKLFGIIGPSGIGKTTFLSILGGQLRPHSGIVEVQAVNIYDINDHLKRQLIAIQGQITSSLKGTIKYNLLFGLPYDIACVYKDQNLIEILEKVGLWSISKEKEGLNTQVGESGFTLSGGQRQRLNFANLYLRASHYKPCLILIDEPTSSLDEISEKAITDMIKELSLTAVTIVIAHRLKTIEDAYGIIDFSLIQEHQKIIIYSKDKLKQISPYYQKLMAGEIKFAEES